jgi:SmpA / OmlA family
MRIKRVQSIAVIAAAFLALSVPRTGRAAGDAPQPLHKGMTEAQVEKLYGEPDERSESDSGTTWTYTKIGAKAFIPFVGAFNHSIKVITVTFRRGRVASYDVEQ